MVARTLFASRSLLSRAAFCSVLILSGAVAKAQRVPSSTTTLAVSPSNSPLPPNTKVALTATVTQQSSGQPIFPGQVIFCDVAAAHPDCSGLSQEGTAQLLNSGTATISLVPGGGNHSYIAIFPGTPNNSPPVAGSDSTPQDLTVSWPTTTNIASTGSVGNYTLTATVRSTGSYKQLTGNVSFVDTTSGNNVLGTAPLGTPVFSQSFTAGPGSPVSVDGIPYAIATGDFNGDGFADLAVTNNNSANVTILLGNGNGGLTAAPGSPVAVGTNPRSVAVVDFNGDGKTDLVVGNFGSNTVSILLGSGDGHFVAASGSPITVGASPEGVATGDFNGDGLADLAVVNRGSNNVSVLLGNGDGTFTTAGSPGGVYSAPSSIAVGDFNADGNLDLAVSNSSASGPSANTVSIVLGNGNGTFTPATGSPVPVGRSPGSLVVGDFNGDSKRDLAIANVGDGTISILIGNGNGSFTPAAAVPVGGFPSGVAIGDFNGDGIPDLAVSDVTSNVSIWQGHGDGTFVAANPITIFEGPLGLVVGDFNGNGIDDVAAVNNGSNSVSVALNNVTQTATAQLTGATVPGSGIHQVNATYPGDTNFSSSVSSTIPLIGAPLTTTLALSAAPTSSTFGQQVVLTATLAPNSLGNLSTNGQTVNFYNGATLLGPGTLTSGVATFNTTTLPVGVNSLRAVYAGDTNFLGSTSPNLSFTVSKSTPGSGGVAAVTVTSSLNPSGYGQNVTFTAAVPTGATGTITFADNGSVISRAIAITGTTAAFTTSTLLVGTHPITAVYSGDGNYNGATSASLPQVVNQASGSTVLTVNPSTVMYGDTSTLTAVVSPAGATGTVTFMATPTSGGSAITLGTSSLNGTETAVWPESTLSAGVYNVVAHYNGDQNFGANSSPPVQLTVTQRTGSGPNGAALTVTANDASRTTTQANPPFSYTVSGTLVNGDTYATAVTGTPVYSAYTGSTPGTYPISIASGLTSANYVIAFAAGTLTVVSTPTTTTLATSPGSPQYGDPVTLTAMVNQSGVTGTVSFYDGTVFLGQSSVSNGVATLTTTMLPAGTHSIAATYNGDGTYASSASSPVTVTVAKKTGTGPGGAALTVTVQDASREYGAANPEFVYVVTGTLVNNDTYANAVTGVPVYSTTAAPTSPVGSTFPITVSGLVSQNYVVNFVNGTLTIVPAPTTTALMASVTSAQYGDPVTLAATVTSGATGTVSFVNGSTVLGQGTITGGIATLTTTTLQAGTYVVTAIYQGDGNYSSSSSGPVMLTITKRTGSGPNGAALMVTVNNVSRAYGQGNPAFSYTVAGTLVNNDTYANAVTGVPVYSTTATVTSPVGSYPVSVNNLVSTNYVVAFVNGTVTVTKGTPSVVLSSSLNPSTYQQSITFTATPSAGATGTVNFLDGTTALCSNISISNGTATCTTAALAASTHPITAVYSGDSNYNDATSTALQQVVNKAGLGSGAPSITVTSSQNPAPAGRPVTFTATVPSGATGTVTFNGDGVAISGCTNVTISGTTATCVTSSLTPGTHAITAVYSGDSNFNGSASAVLSQVVTNADFALTANNPTYQTVIPGNSVTYTFTFTPAGGSYPCAINFAATSNPTLPTGYQITVTPTHVAAGANTQTVSLQITTAAVASGRDRRSPRPLHGVATLALILLPLSLARKSRRLMGPKLQLFGLAAASTVAAVALAGCGGGFFGQAPQNYTITLTATSACGAATETSHTSTVTLNVQ